MGMMYELRGEQVMKKARRVMQNLTCVQCAVPGACGAQQHGGHQDLVGRCDAAAGQEGRM